ncbi:tail fiber domain-containing protein [Geothermobacter hydrogeniphilus]|nr:tail fiber domain-containing protein [Geothermobacter hydrogeniphilus]
MKKPVRITLSFLLVITLLGTSAFAAPNLINYQGVLTDSSGAPITNSGQAMTFRLFDAATGGTQLWEEVRTVDVQNGSYNLLLGSVTPFTTNLFQNDNLWLEIGVAGEVLGGRQRLASVPYALRADTATTVTGTASGDGSGLTNLDWANLANVPAGFADNTDNIATSVNGMTGGLITGQTTVTATGVSPAGSFTTSGANQARGIEGKASENNSTDSEHTGVFGYGYWGKSSYGVYGSGGGGTIQSNGVFGYAYQGSGKNSGVRGLSNGTSGTNYGLYGDAKSGANGNYGLYATTIGTGSNDFAGYLDGDASVVGGLTVGSGVKDANSQLHVQTTKEFAGYFSNSRTSNSPNKAYGVYSLVNGTPIGTNYHWGTYTESSGAFINYGVQGVASGTQNNYAVYGWAHGGVANYAGFFNGDESDGISIAAVKIVSSGQNMLIDGNEIDSNVALHLNYTSTQDVDIANGGGNVGIGSIADATYKLFVNGDIFVTSGVSVNGWTQASDRRFKTNIRPLQNALKKVSQLRGVSYDWRIDEFPERGFIDEPQIGVIAQEVEPIVPELVHTDAQGYKSVAYDKMSALLIEAVKDLKAENEALRLLVCQDHPTARICQ